MNGELWSRSCVLGKGETSAAARRQELFLWKNRQDKRCPGYPSVPHKRCKEAQPFDNRHKPTCVVSQLGTRESTAGSAALSDVGQVHSPAQKQRHELLWRDFFSDPTQWWDNRWEKRSPRHPDFRHKRSKQALWLDNPYKPAWVDAKLAMWDAQLTVGPPQVTPSRMRNEGDAEVKAWTIICEEAQLTEAVEALDLLVNRGSYVETSLLYRILKRCIAEKDLALGRRVHGLIVDSGYESDAFLANHIIHMYAAHGRLEEANEVFSKVPVPDSYMWASIISAHADHGQPTQGINLYRQMRQSIVKPSSQVFVAVLKACATSADSASGKEVHDDICRSGLECDDVFVGSSLVSMYAKCGQLEEARIVFDRLPIRNVVTWNAMITGYVQNGLGREALNLYGDMQQDVMTSADHVTFVCLLQACGIISALDEGRQLHVKIQERGLEADVVVGSCLVDMYIRCGRLQDARTVFDRLSNRNVVTWTTMIAGYTDHGLGQEALAIYASMGLDNLTLANHVTFMCLLKACASIGALSQGKQLHAQIRERGLEGNVVVGNCLVDMYSKCGNLEDARAVFDGMPTRDVVTWTTMIRAYAQQEMVLEALSLYESMQRDGITLSDHVTFVCLLQACANAGALQQGKHLHEEIHRRGLDADVVVGSCLVRMYVKCGSLKDARTVLDRVPTTDVVTWTALLNGYAEHGEAQMAMQSFVEMLQQGVKPNDVTFLCLLMACSHEGLVQEGKRYFKMMAEDYGIPPTASHYGCMVDLLGRAGLLDEAEDMLREMPFQNDIVGWTALLTACKSHGDIERGQRCFESLVALEPASATPYVLLGNIYASAKRWSDVERIENLRISACAWKKPAKACIEVKRKVHEFTVGEERAGISSELKSTILRLKEEGGHVPQTELVLKSVSDSEKEDSLCGHAEKLALAYGLLNTPHGTPLLVTKNLRMCNDCHSSTKIMSSLEKREIVVRDAHRVHRFLDGSCSCKDRH